MPFEMKHSTYQTTKRMKSYGWLGKLGEALEKRTYGRSLDHFCRNLDGTEII